MGKRHDVERYQQGVPVVLNLVQIVLDFCIHGVFLVRQTLKFAPHYPRVILQ
jgi:hypothetical protein